MENIPEDFIHYLWKYKLYCKQNLFTESEEKVEIIENGWHNKDSGPDFFNAKIKIGETLWAGNVEIHKRSSDWYHHKHHLDKAYDNVILQVVLENNGQTKRTNGTVIPTLTLNFDDKLYNNYMKLLSNENWIPCEQELSYIDHFTINFWLDKLTIERLMNKYDEITGSLKTNNNNWETTFYHKLAKNFGFKVNSIPFELLAQSLPIEYLAKHKDNKFQIEALLFGQAGFLQGNMSNDEYYLKLCREYNYLKKKFNLRPINKHIWKFSKLRPSNFPTIRIAQFAEIIYNSKKLFSKILEAENIQYIHNLFDIKLSGYWTEHYTFQKASKTKKNKKLGKSAINTVIINTVIPFLFIYGERKNKQGYKNKALNFLNQLPPENNSIIKKWKKLNIIPESAYQSQALIQLKNIYCKNKKCLECQIGKKIISY
ncbi:MAG: DUF2851 family protein [Bacteroidales bacterium]